MDKPKCETCIYVEKFDQWNQGHCHLNPKIEQVNKNHWCGQHNKFKDYLANLQFANWAISTKQDGKPNA